MVDAPREVELRGAIEDFYFAYRAFTTLPDGMLAERRLGRTHHRVLYFVARNPGLTVGELLRILDITKQAAHRPIKDLVAQGLLTTTSDQADGRVRRLTVTPAGSDLEAQLSAAQMRLLDEAFASAGPGGESAWRAIMGHLRAGSR